MPCADGHTEVGLNRVRALLHTVGTHAVGYNRVLCFESERRALPAVCLRRYIMVYMQPMRHIRYVRAYLPYVGTVRTYAL